MVPQPYAHPRNGGILKSGGSASIKQAECPADIRGYLQDSGLLGEPPPLRTSPSSTIQHVRVVEDSTINGDEGAVMMRNAWRGMGENARLPDESGSPVA